MITIKRDKYLNQLINKIDNGMIKIITGLRTSGKSYLLNEIFYQYLLSEKGVKSSHVIKFAFDNDEDLRKIGEDLLELKIEKR